jgi:hypothetical protein
MPVTPARVLRFQGNSDDTFGLINDIGDDYDNCASMKPIRYQITAGGKGLRVTGQYSPGNSGCWLIGVEYAQEDHQPDWPCWFEFGPEHGYSPTLCLQVPQDAVINCMERDVDGRDD